MTLESRLCSCPYVDGGANAISNAFQHLAEHCEHVGLTAGGEVCELRCDAAAVCDRFKAWHTKLVVLLAGLEESACGLQRFYESSVVCDECVEHGRALKKLIPTIDGISSKEDVPWQFMIYADAIALAHSHVRQHCVGYEERTFRCSVCALSYDTAQLLKSVWATRTEGQMLMGRLMEVASKLRAYCARHMDYCSTCVDHDRWLQEAVVHDEHDCPDRR